MSFVSISILPTNHIHLALGRTECSPKNLSASFAPASWLVFLIFLYLSPSLSFPLPTDPKVIIIDEEGSALQDKYYEVDSTLQLSCIVRNVKMTSTAVYWSHGDRILNYDVDRGGIK